tara:strand:+ start:22 stop:519 length:498 start_codon:yes stop_codon:yes gene_type:complete
MKAIIIVLTMLLALPAIAQAPADAPESDNPTPEAGEPSVELGNSDAVAEEVVEEAAEIVDEQAQDDVTAEEEADIEAQTEAPLEVQAQAPAAPVRQGTEVVNLSDTIVGNQEQPTVLYIVPWKPAEDTTILYLPLSSKAMEHIFGHVERVEHQRQVQYIDQLDKQ